MSYPDDYEAHAEAMLADLAAAGEVPESIRLTNDAAIESIANGALRPGTIFDAIFRDRSPDLTSSD